MALIRVLEFMQPPPNREIKFVVIPQIENPNYTPDIIFKNRIIAAINQKPFYEWLYGYVCRPYNPRTKLYENPDLNPNLVFINHIVSQSNLDMDFHIWLHGIVFKALEMV